jgi:hypothetical protein
MPKYTRRLLRVIVVCLTTIISLALILPRFEPPTVKANNVAFSFGHVFAGVGNGKVQHFDSTGTLLDTLDTTSGSRNEAGMCFDSHAAFF